MTNKMTTIEGNKIIAEFMAIKIERPNYLLINQKSETKTGWYQVDRMLYHTSWDWLMPVVEKIELIEFEPKDGDDTVNWNVPYLRTFHSSMTRINRFTLHGGGTRIENTFNACIEFINWYNSQSK